MVNPTGYTALDLVGFTDKGPYAPNVNYVRNDLSHDSGNIWKCLIDDTIGIRPTEGANWTIFISEPSNMVETSIAPIETSPATAAHTVGAQLYYNDTLYKVKAAIAVGDSLVVDTNIELADNITTQLAAKANTSDLGTAAAKDSTSTIAQGSTDLIESGAVYSALGDKANTADLGTAAAKDSTNAVTQSSTDLVESGAVYSELGSVKQALSDEVETRAKLTAHNLLALTIANLKTLNTHGSWVGNVFTHDGVAYTVDLADSGYVKSITASGTAGTYSYMYLSRSAIPLYFNKGNYIFTGCPSGGSSTTYFISDNYYYNGAYVAGDKDTGNGDSASIVNDGSNFTGSIAIYAAAGNVNLVFNPMIRLASDPSTKFTPYAMTNQQLTDAVVGDDGGDITTETGFTYNSSSSFFFKKKDVCTITANFSKSSAVSANTQYTVGTIASGYRPSKNVVVPAMIVYSASGLDVCPAVLVILATGGVLLRTGTLVPTEASLTIVVSACYKV